MSIILKHILRNIKKNKIRSLLIIVALSIATTVLVIDITLPNEIVLKYEESLRGVYGKTDIEVTTVGSFGIEDLTLKNEKITTTGVSTLKTETIDNKRLSILGIDIENAKILDLIGKDVPVLNDNEVVMTKKMAQEFDYKVGSILKVTYEDKIYDFKVVKLIDEKGLSTLNIEDKILYANINTVNNIKKIEVGKFETLYIDVSDDSKIEDFREYLKDNNENYIIKQSVDEDAIKDQSTMASSLMTIIVVMSTIMIFFVISSLNKIIIAERIPVIGTFRSIGATKHKMNLILILENAVYGLFGGIIGSALGYILKSKVSTILFMATDNINLSEKTTSLSLGTIVTGILFAILLQIVITIKEIMKTNNKPIKDMIFNTKNSKYKLRKTGTIIGFIMVILAIILNFTNSKSNMGFAVISLMMFFIGIANIVPFIMQIISKLLSSLLKRIGLSTSMVATRNIGFNKMLISSSKLIVVALSLMLSIISISDSTTKVFNSFRDLTEGYDIVIQNVNNNAEKYNELTKLDSILGVRYLYAFIDEKTTYNNGKKFNFYPMIVGEEDSSIYIKEFDYKIKDLKNNEVLLDEKFAYKNDILIGDILNIKLETLNKELKYKVVGFVDAFSLSVQRSVIISQKEFFKENITDIPMQVHLSCAENADLEKVKEDVEDQIKEVGIQVQTVEEYIKTQQDQVESIISMFYVILGLAVILSFIGIINNQIIGFMQRTKELAILNSTCMSKGQIKKMLFIEILLSNMFACILAVLSALLSTKIMEKTLHSMATYINVEFNWNSTIWFVGIMFIILLATILIPFKKLKKMNIVNEIKYE